MSVFNYIHSSLTCPNCHGVVEWQSKRLSFRDMLLANAMQSIDLDENLDGEMHAACGSCRTWIDAEIGAGQVVAVKTEPLPDKPLA